MKKFIASMAIAMSVVMPHAFAEGVVDTSKINKELITTTDDKKYTIATVVKVDGIAWFDRMRDGVEQFKTDTGNDVWMVGPSQADAAAQVQIVENLIAQGVDAIAIVPFSVEAVEPVLKGDPGRVKHGGGLPGQLGVGDEQQYPRFGFFLFTCHEKTPPQAHWPRRVGRNPARRPPAG